MWSRTSSSRSRTRRYLRFSFAFFKVRLNAAKVTLVGMLFFALLVLFMDYREHRLSAKLRSKIIEVTLPILDFSAELSRSVVNDVYEFLNPDHRFEFALKRREERIVFLKQEVQRLQHEIGYLKQNLDFKQHLPGGKWVATTIFLPLGFQSIYKGFVRLGEQDGASQNAPVISQYGLIGKLINVSDKVSEILLLGHPMFSVPVYVERTNHQCVVRGTDEGHLAIDYIDVSQLQTGDRLLTSGQGGIFPRGVSVATVQKESEAIAFIPTHTLSQTHLGYILLSGASDAN